MRKMRNFIKRNHHKGRRSKQMAINLVSLMDIFTILVFFLLVNSGDVQVLPNVKQMTLPDSVSDQIPKMTVVVSVNKEHISVQGKQIITVKEASQSDSDTIVELSQALNQITSLSQLNEKGLEGIIQKDITIMGDESIPYILLKKVMHTCATANYTNVFLAVNKKSSLQAGVSSI